jgi:hypothetical protein
LVALALLAPTPEYANYNERKSEFEFEFNAGAKKQAHTHKKFSRRNSLLLLLSAGRFEVCCGVAERACKCEGVVEKRGQGFIERVLSVEAIGGGDVHKSGPPASRKNENEEQRGQIL